MFRAGPLFIIRRNNSV